MRKGSERGGRKEREGKEGGREVGLEFLPHLQSYFDY